MAKKENVSLSKNFEKDIGLFLGLGSCLGTILGVVVGLSNENIGLWLALGICFGISTSFFIAIIKNFDELSRKIKNDKAKKPRN